MFFKLDGIPFSEPLFTMICEVRKGIKQHEYFAGNAFEVEIKRDVSKISTDYPIDQLSECEIKTEQLYDILFAYSNEMKKIYPFLHKY